MPQQQEEIPQIVIQGLNALDRVETIISKQIQFDYNDLDQADQLRNAIDIVKNDLANYNQVIRQTKAQQQQAQQVQQKNEPSEADGESNLKAVETEESSEESE